MTLDFATLESLRTRHPAWRLLRSDHAPLVASFLQRVFIASNVRVMAAAEFMNCQPVPMNTVSMERKPGHSL